MRSRRSDPLLSTILLNWNRADLLERTLDSYFATTRAECELFIIDSGSSDTSRSVIERFARGRANVVPIFLWRNQGGRALHHGLRRARGRVLHISANDLEYRPGWDTESLEALEAFPEVGQLSLFSPFPEVGEGEIGVHRRATQEKRGGATLFLAHGHVPVSSLVRREVLAAGVRWNAFAHDGYRLPDTIGFSAAVRKAGYAVAWSAHHLAKNWGRNVEEIARGPAYYAGLFRAKRAMERLDLFQVLEAHGFTLGEDEPRRPAVRRFAPSPAVPEGARLISASPITVVEGQLRVSRVYDDGRRIYKQATGDLVLREARLLERLGSHRFPRVLDVARFADDAVLVLERLDGEPLVRAAAEIRSDPERLRRFVRGCLEILGELQQKQIQHRDIHERNLIVQDGWPVLIDFGWSAAADDPAQPPPDRIWTRPPDGSLCDVYSMGRVLEELIPEQQSGLRTVAGLMTEADPDLRITDLSILRALVESLARDEQTRQRKAGPTSVRLSAEAGDPVRVDDRLIARLVHQIALLRASSPAERPAMQQEEIPVATRSRVAAAWRRARSAVRAVLLRAAAGGGAAGRRILILVHRCQ